MGQFISNLFLSICGGFKVKDEALSVQKTVISNLDSEQTQHIISTPTSSGLGLLFSQEVIKQSKRKSDDTPKYEKLKRQVVNKELWIKHYSNQHNMLLVGEGDFSFSASLCKAFGSATNMVATSLNSIDFLRSNYSKAVANIQQLKGSGCTVIHGVDATKMTQSTFFKLRKFDRIVFNFPHAGFNKRTKTEELQICQHQQLVSGFLSNAKELIAPEGEIHISHMTVGFYGHWRLQILGTNVGLRLIQKVSFELSDYPGYNTKYGFGGDKNFDCHPSITYKFGI